MVFTSAASSGSKIYVFHLKIYVPILAKGREKEAKWEERGSERKNQVHINTPTDDRTFSLGILLRAFNQSLFPIFH